MGKMRWCALLLTVSSIAAQAAGAQMVPKKSTRKSTRAAGSKPSTAEEIQALRTMVEQQHQTVQQLQQQLQQRDAQMQQLQQAVQQAQTAATEAQAKATAAESMATEQKASVSTLQNDVTDVKANFTQSAVQTQEEQKRMAAIESPLQIHVGSATITPVGFMDFTTVFRDNTGGSGIGTNFAGIPYGNVYQTNLSEFRFSMQNSRIGFRVDANVKGAHVIGYMESDFLGNNPGNVAVSSNSNTLRSRLYWVDVAKNKWEVLGGQTWSLITPGRTGISPIPGNLFYTQNIDVNYQAGLVWGRIPEFRVVYHPTKKAALAFALDSPEQYFNGSAGGPAPTLPTALTALAGTQLNNGNTTLGVPNVAPDVIVKAAFDPSSRVHFEFGGVARWFKLWNPSTNTTYTATGGGGFLNANLEVVKGFRLVTNNYWSDGGGRYIFGQAPDLIVRTNGSPSLIHAGSTVTGFELTHKNSLLYAYYGGIFVGRDAVLDTNGKLVGYGYPGSSAAQNRTIQEATFGFTQTLWKDATYGALQFMTQYSYLQRNPWAVATGQPKNANLNMLFLNLRYTLPGSAPAIK